MVPDDRDLEADPTLRDRYQFWTFGYSTGDPIPYSASLLRHNLDEVRRKFDPDGSDTAFDRMVVVGHSMGGLLAKMMVQESGTRLWRSSAIGPSRTSQAIRPIATCSAAR